MCEMDRHIKTLSGQLSDHQTRLLAAEELSSTLRDELDRAKDEIRLRVTSEASFASMEAALRAKSAQVCTMESLVKAREGQVDAVKRLLAANPNFQRRPEPDVAIEEPSIVKDRQEFGSVGVVQTGAPTSEEAGEEALHQRLRPLPQASDAGPSGIIEGRSFADTLRN